MKKQKLTSDLLIDILKSSGFREANQDYEKFSEMSFHEEHDENEYKIIWVTKGEEHWIWFDTKTDIASSGVEK